MPLAFDLISTFEIGSMRPVATTDFATSPRSTVARRPASMAAADPPSTGPRRPGDHDDAHHARADRRLFRHSNHPHLAAVPTFRYGETTPKVPAGTPTPSPSPAGPAPPARGGPCAPWPRAAGPSRSGGRAWPSPPGRSCSSSAARMISPAGSPLASRASTVKPFAAEFGRAPVEVGAVFLHLLRFAQRQLVVGARGPAVGHVDEQRACAPHMRASGCTCSMIVRSAVECSTATRMRLYIVGLRARDPRGR